MAQNRRALTPATIFSKGWAVGIYLLSVTLTFAQGDAYSSTRMRSLKAVRASDQSKACMSFEAEFSSPLKEKPGAIIDMEMLHTIRGIVSEALEVFQVSDKKYRFDMKLSDPACKAFRQANEGISVTVDGAKGADGNPVLPDQRAFGSGKISR